MSSRLYHLAPPDRTGWFLGLGPAQIVPLATGLSLAAVVLARTQSLAWAALPFVLGVALGFARVGDQPLIPSLFGRARWWAAGGQRRFEAPLPISGPDPVLPAALGACKLLTDPGPEVDGPVVVSDPRAGLIAASIRVSTGSSLLLAEPAEQDRLLSAFGDALVPLAHEADRIVSLRWTSFAAPTATAALPDDLEGPAIDSYQELLRLIAETPHHEVLMTLTMTRARSGQDHTLIDEMRRSLDLLVGRMTAAGFSSVPVDRAMLGTAMRRRLDPAGRGSGGAVFRPTHAHGLPNLAAAGPLTVVEHWDHLQIDATRHRAYYVVDWPRTGVPAAWMPDLLLALPPGRTLCVVLEPVSIRASRRGIQRQAAKLDSDAEQRERHGFRVGADHDAARSALAAREVELMAGHSEFDFTGVVTLSAANLADLDAKEAQASSIAGTAGVELAPLHGRHAAGVGLCLPIPGRLAGRSR